jgi:hypothetical protein
LTPEEVEKIRRLAEGLLFMGEVEKQRGGAALREDLNALRLFISRGAQLKQPTLARLEAGLRAYVGRMRAQLAQGKRAYEQFQRDPLGALMNEGGGRGGLQTEVYADLTKTLRKVRRKLAGHQTALQALPPPSHQGGQLLETLQSSLDSLSALHRSLLRVQREDPPPPSRSPQAQPSFCSSSHVEIDEEDVKLKAGAVFRVGCEVTEDQIAAAEHLLRACEEFRQRLLKKPAASAVGGGVVVVEESTRQQAIRRKSVEAQKKLFSKDCWSPVY